jgi:molybdenum cofactor cytidylyltransferase
MVDFTCVLLAAGSSSRFGSNKLLALLDGQPLINHSAASLEPCDGIIAVVRADDVPLHAALHILDIDYVINPEPDRGMGYSIACAVNATAGSDGWLLMPADMPFVRPSTTQRIIAAMDAGAPLAAPVFQGQRGHPVAFSKDFFAQLAACDGDTGARHILQQHRQQLVTIDTDDAGVLVDIDRPTDL